MLSEERRWAGELIDLVSEREAAIEAHRSDPNAHHEAFVPGDVFSDFASKKLLPDIKDYDGRPITELVAASEEISRDGIIMPGAISVPKIAGNVGVKSNLLALRKTDTYSTELPNYILVEEFTLGCQGGVKNVLEEARCELKASHGDGYGRAWCLVTVQEAGGEEQTYAEWSTTDVAFVSFSNTEEAVFGEGKAVVVRFYLKVEVLEKPPPGGIFPKALMRNPGVRGRRYALRVEVP